MKIQLIKVNNTHLAPSLEQDEEVIEKWKTGDILSCDVKKARNLRFHRKFFALMQIVFKNQNKYDNLTDLLTEVKLRTGHYEEHLTLKGVLIYTPKSIAFEKMDDFAFSIFYQKTLDICLKYFCVGSSGQELEHMVNIVLGFI